MAHLFALLSSDPSLLRCQIHRLRDTVSFGERFDALGLGYYADDAVLLSKRPGDVGERDVAALSATIRSPALIASAQSAGARFDEDATDPFRMRRWLFAMDGALAGFEAFREPLVASLPDFLRRQIRSATDREHLFALFLHELREQGRLDDLTLTAQEAAQSLASAVRTADRLATDAGHAKPSPLVALATNGRLLIAVRRGRPLSYSLVEGLMDCEPCELPPPEGTQNAKLGAHRRCKAVAIATQTHAGGGFIEVPDGSTVAIGRALDLTVASL